MVQMYREKKEKIENRNKSTEWIPICFALLVYKFFLCVLLLSLHGNSEKLK